MRYEYPVCLHCRYHDNRVDFTRVTNVGKHTHIHSLVYISEYKQNLLIYFKIRYKYFQRSNKVNIILLHR